MKPGDHERNSISERQLEELKSCRQCLERILGKPVEINKEGERWVIEADEVKAEILSIGGWYKDGPALEVQPRVDGLVRPLKRNWVVAYNLSGDRVLLKLVNEEDGETILAIEETPEARGAYRIGTDNKPFVGILEVGFEERDDEKKLVLNTNRITGNVDVFILGNDATIDYKGGLELPHLKTEIDIALSSEALEMVIRSNNPIFKGKGLEEIKVSLPTEGLPDPGNLLEKAIFDTDNFGKYGTIEIG